ncbi:MAG: alginate export family protein [Blastocatellia bacterium]
MKQPWSLFLFLLLFLTSAVARAQTAAPTPEPIKIGAVTLSGSLRLRAESWDWFDAPPADGSYTFGAGTLRLALGQRRDKLEWQVEAAAPFFMGLPANAIAPAPRGQLGLGANYFAANGRRDASVFLKQAWIRVKGLAGDKASDLKLGRLEFSDGLETTPADPGLATLKRDHISQRLLGPFGFTHVGRSFDGAQYTRNAKAGNFTLLAARPTEGVFQLAGMKQLDIDFYYGAFTRPWKTKTREHDARLFVLHYHDGRRALKTDNRPQAARVADLEKIRLTTVGGHYAGVYQNKRGRADLLLWGAGQLGGWGSLAHRAGAIAVEAGYQFNTAGKPWLRAGWFHGSGDGDPADTRHNTFFQHLPTPRIYARTPFYNLMNNEDTFVQLRLKPHARLALRGDLHHLRLSSARDQWYVGGGAFQRNTFGYVARPADGQRGLGTLADLGADFTITARTAFTLYLAGVKGHGVARNIYPAGHNARFAYVEITQRF